MNLFQKILTGLALTSILFLSFTPLVNAQSILDDIKAKLEGEGITVIDYSSPEAAWGSLPNEWITFLSRDFENLADLAENDDRDGLEEDDFIGPGGLTDLRRQLAILIAEKSRLTTETERDNIQAEIDELQGNPEEGIIGSIPQLTEEIKDDIADLIADADDLNQEEGINLIFEEVNFYHNYSKWGRLPLRIIGILETSTNDFRNLQDILDTYDLSTEEGVREAQTFLRGLESEDANGNPIRLSEDDVELILESTLILLSPGESQINQLGRAVANVIKNLAGALAVIWIIVAATRMIFAQGEESVITEQKKAIIYGILGLIAILLVDRVIDTIYGPAGIQRTELTPDQGFSNEVYGLVTFIKALVGMTAILFIVVSGIRMLFAQGEDEQISKQRKSVLWIGVGLILVAIDKIIVDNFFIIPVEQSDQIRTSNITTIINTGARVLQFGLGFVGLIAFAALIYGATSMIANYGNDEMVERAKKIIRNAIIGILVILSAYVIVATLVVFR